MNLFETMKQARTLKKEMGRQQKELARLVFDAQTGGGMVSARVNGKLELIELKIEPEVLQSGDAKFLQDLIRSAVNEAFRKAQEAAQQMMSQMMGAMGNMGGLGDLLK